MTSPYPGFIDLFAHEENWAKHQAPQAHTTGDPPSDAWSLSRERYFLVPHSQNYDHQSQRADTVTDYQVWNQQSQRGVGQPQSNDTREPSHYDSLYAVQPTRISPLDGVAIERTYPSVATLEGLASGQFVSDELSTTLYHQFAGNQFQPHLADTVISSSLLHLMQGKAWPEHSLENEWPNSSSPPWLQHLSGPTSQPPTSSPESPATGTSLNYPTTQHYQVERAFADDDLHHDLSTTQHGAPHSFSGLTSGPYSCRWEGYDQALPCDATLTGDVKELRDHLRVGHGFRCSGTNQVKCSWANCEQYLRRDNVARHIVSRHLQVKVSCTACGVELCRNDVRYAHVRRCRAALEIALSEAAVSATT